MTAHATRLIALLASLFSAGALNAAVITYSFTADGGHSGSFSYDNSVTSNGQIPFGQGGPSYAGLSFELNGNQQANPVIQIFNDYQGVHDIVYFTTHSGGPAIQLWGNSSVFASSNLSELDLIELADFSNIPSNLLYTGIYPSGPTPLLSFDNADAVATPIVSTQLTLLLGLAGMYLRNPGMNRRLK